MFKCPHTGSSWMAQLLQDLVPTPHYFLDGAIRPLSVQEYLQSMGLNSTCSKLRDYMTRRLFEALPRFGGDRDVADLALGHNESCFIGYSMTPPHTDANLEAPWLQCFQSVLQNVLDTDGVRDRATVLFYARTNAVKVAIAHSGARNNGITGNASVPKKLLSPRKLLQKVQAMNNLSLIHI